MKSTISNGKNFYFLGV